MGLGKLLLLLAFFVTPLEVYCQAPKLPWIVYYGDQTSPELFDRYNPIIFDGIHHPKLKPLLDKGKTILGYINLGEVEDRYPGFEEMKSLGVLIEENPNWPGSYTVDIRNPKWQDLMVKKIIPEIFAQGFTGLFFDQLDIALDLEEKDPQKYKGMKQAAIQIVQLIRKHYPTKDLMMNRAYEILPQVGGLINFELAEELYSEYNFDQGKYQILPKKNFEWQLGELNRARFQYPKLVIFSLDYFDPNDVDITRKIYAAEREAGMRPYVSTVKLDEISKEPDR